MDEPQTQPTPAPEPVQDSPEPQPALGDEDATMTAAGFRKVHGVWMR